MGTPVLILVEDEEHVGAFIDYQPDSGGVSAEKPAASSSQEPDAGQRSNIHLPHVGGSSGHQRSNCHIPEVQGRRSLELTLG